MIEIKKAEQTRCCNCCSSKQDVYNVTFWKDGTNSGTQVALCKKCMDEFGKLARLIEHKLARLIEHEDNKNDGDSDDLISRKETIRYIRENLPLGTFMHSSVKQANAACWVVCNMIADEVPSAESKEQITEVIEHDASVTDTDGYKYHRSEYLCGACKKKVIGGDCYCSYCGARLEWK